MTDISLKKFIENYLLINDKNGNLVKFKPTKFQLDFIENIDNGLKPYLSNGRKNSEIIWK